VGCGSGNRIINTKGKTATGHDKTGAYLKDDKSNGAVEILGSTKIQITLMPMAMDDSKPMATAVTAKVKALGDNSSGYSAETKKTLSGGMGM
jgi:hypothetical protein